MFHVANNELLTYPVVEQHKMIDLHKRIEEETKIPVAEQDIILATGLTPDYNDPADVCWLEPVCLFLLRFNVTVNNFVSHVGTEPRLLGF